MVVNYSWPWALLWSMVNLPSETPLKKTKCSLASVHWLQVASWLGWEPERKGASLIHWANLCMCVLMYVCVDMCVHEHGEDKLGVLSPQSLSTFFVCLLEKGLWLSWSCVTVLQWRTSKPGGSACLHLPSSGITTGPGVSHTVRVFEPRSSCLQGGHSTHEAISQFQSSWLSRAVSERTY